MKNPLATTQGFWVNVSKGPGDHRSPKQKLRARRARSRNKKREERTQ